MKRSAFLIFQASLICLALLGCGGGSAIRPPADPPAAQLPDGAPGELAASVLREASGDPSGVRVFWAPVEGNVVGYHLYKLPESVSGDIRGDEDLMVEVNGSTTIPQPTQLDQNIVVDDLFPAVIGEDYFYYLTTLDGDGDESLLSRAFTITILNFTIEALSSPAVAVGESFQISGDNFGEYDDLQDRVEVAGVEWVSGSGFAPVMLEAPIIEWTDELITAELPPGATSGRVHVTVGGATQFSLDVLTNSDPYITSISPIKADMRTPVTLSGNNFGGQQDADHLVVLNSVELDNIEDYATYSNNSIVFTFPAPSSFSIQPLFVRADGTDSNQGFLEVVNAAPVASLSASPETAIAPAEISFDPAGSFDPEGGSLTLEYDFEDDGTFDLTAGDTSPVLHTYSLPGSYTCRLQLTDSEGATSQATADVLINTFGLRLSDAGSPRGGEYFQDDQQIILRYNISGGQAPYTIDWVLTDAGSGVPGENIGQSQHDAPGLYTFTLPIDTVVPRLPGEAKLNAGTWTVTGQPADQLSANDPDAPFVWPRNQFGEESQLVIWRYDVGIVRDAEGDPNSSELGVLQSALSQRGFKTTVYQSSGLLIENVGTHHALLWAADGPRGSVTPFEWLQPQDLGLAMDFVDRGSSLIILGPPAIDFNGQPFSDPEFNSSYQPFTTTNSETIGTTDLTPLGYTAVNDFTIGSIQYSSAWGNNLLQALLPGSSEQINRSLSGNVFRMAGARPGPGGGNTYVGMFVYSAVTGVNPPGTETSRLLDNIVAGTIQRQ